MNSYTVLLPCNFYHTARWGFISNFLNSLADKCLLFRTQGQQVAEGQHGPSRDWLGVAIKGYNQSAFDNCNFQVFQDDNNLVSRLINVLPFMIDIALKLPQLTLNRSIHILKAEENKTVTLNRKLICCLLAHGFLSTFPRRNDEDSKYLPNFNFWRLFHHKEDDKSTVKREKIKCLLEYFEEMGSTGNDIPTSDVTFERRFIKTQINWKNSTEKLHILCVVCGNGIENAKGMLQVDFANKFIGGGVLADGAVQEEIRFLICPELLVSRLFTDKLGPNEVVIITGSIQFSDYTGYRQDFKFKKLQVEVDKEGDILPRTEAQVVAMDARPFPPKDINVQYRKYLIDRELHKSFVGFSPGRQGCKTPIATGNWGCGAFNGDPQLKFIIQWMAASHNQRSVQYYARNEDQKKELEAMARYLVSRKVTVGQLYQVLIHYDRDIVGKIPRDLPRTVFQYLVDKIK